MPAAGEYLPPGVEGGRVGEEHDHVGLGEAEPAHAGGRVEVLGPGKDGPVDVVVGVVVLQLPDVLAEGGGRCMAVAEGVGVPVVALLEGVAGEAGVGAGAPGVLPGDGGPVHQAGRQAPPLDSYV